MIVGQSVNVFWTSCGHQYCDSGTIATINKKSIIVCIKNDLYHFNSNVVAYHANTRIKISLPMTAQNCIELFDSTETAFDIARKYNTTIYESDGL